MGRNDERRTVWSSDGPEPCAGCGREPQECACRAAAPAGDGKVRVWRETKGRRGKTVTVVRGLALDAEALTDLASELKKSCGAGGAVKDGAIEIQGDRRDRVVELLVKRGIAAKPAGG
jgi:translation initiation factor 1